MGISINQSEERREFKKRNFKKNVKVNLLRDLTDFASRGLLIERSASSGFRKTLYLKVLERLLSAGNLVALIVRIAVTPSRHK